MAWVDLPQIVPQVTMVGKWMQPTYIALTIRPAAFVWLALVWLARLRTRTRCVEEHRLFGGPADFSL